MEEINEQLSRAVNTNFDLSPPHVAKLCAGTQRLRFPVAWTLLLPRSPGSVKGRGLLPWSLQHGWFWCLCIHQHFLNILRFWTCLHFTARQQMAWNIIPCGLDQGSHSPCKPGLVMVWTRKELDRSNTGQRRTLLNMLSLYTLLPALWSRHFTTSFPYCFLFWRWEGINISIFNF